MATIAGLTNIFGGKSQPAATPVSSSGLGSLSNIYQSPTPQTNAPFSSFSTGQKVSTPVVGKPIQTNPVQQVVNNAENLVKNVVKGVSLSFTKPTIIAPIPQSQIVKTPQASSTTPVQMQTPQVGKPLQPTIDNGQQPSSATMTVTKKSLASQKQNVDQMNAIITPIKQQVDLTLSQAKSAFTDLTTKGVVPNMNQVAPKSEYTSQQQYNQAIKEAKQPSIASSVNQFLGQQLVIAPSLLVGGWLVDPITEAVASRVPDGINILTHILSLAAKGGIKATPFGLVGAELPAKNTQQRIENTALGVATTSLIGMGIAGAGAIASELVAKYGQDAVNFLANKELVYKAVTGQATPEELKQFSILNETGLTAEAARSSEGISINTTTPKQGKMWDILRTIFSTPFSPTTPQGKADIQSLLVSGETTPKDLLNTVFKAGAENTSEGKAIIKAATDAQNQGKNIVINKEGETTPTDYNNLTVTHNGGRSAAEVQQQGLHLARNPNTLSGQAVYFSDSQQSSDTHGTNTQATINTKDFNLKTIDNPLASPETQAYIQSTGAKDLAGAVAKEGYDGFIIPNPNKEVGNTVGITNLDKVNAIVKGESYTGGLSDEAKQVVNDVTEALYSGDPEAAKALHDAYTQDGHQLPSFDSLKAQVDSYHAQQSEQLDSIMADLKAEQKLAEKNNPDDPTNQLLDIAKTLKKHFNAPGAKFKLTGTDRVYTSVEGYSMRVGGKYADVIDRLFHATDIEGFKKNIKILSDKFDKNFTEIYSKIKSGAIDGGDYEQFKTRLSEENSNNQGRINKNRSIAESKANQSQVTSTKSRDALQGSTQPGAIGSNEGSNSNARNVANPEFQHNNESGVRASNTQSSQSPSGSQSNVTNPIFDNLNKDRLSTYGKDIGNAGTGMYRAPGGETQDLVDNNPEGYKQLGVLSVASKDIHVRQDAARILDALQAGKFDDPVSRLQRIRTDLKSEGTPEGNLIGGIINKMLGKESSHPLSEEKSGSQSNVGTYGSKGASPIGAFEKVTPENSEKENFKLFKEVEALTKKYAARIGEGYLNRGNAGQFHTDTLNIRIDGMNDLSVASHEITHFLDQKGKISKQLMEQTGQTKTGAPIYDSKTLQLRKEMSQLYTKYYPTGKADNPLKTRMIEGYATLLQKYVEMPTTIAQEFPNIVKEFLQPEGKFFQPVIGEIIDDLRGIVSKYQGLDALDKIGARVTSEKNPIVKDSYFNFWDKARNTFVDGIWNQEKLNQLAGKARTNEDFSLWMRMAPNHSAIFGNNIMGKKGYYAYRDGQFIKVHDQNWGDLTKTLSKAKQLDSFGYYLVARDQYFNWQTLDKLEAALKIHAANGLELVTRLQDMMLEKELYQPEDFKEIEKEVKAAQKAVENAKQARDEQKQILTNNGFTRQEIEEAYTQNKDRFPDEEKLFDSLVHESLQLAAHPDVQLVKPEQYRELSGKQGYASMKRQIYDELVGDKETGSGVSIGGKRISSMIQRRGGSNTIINPLYNAITNEAEILKKSLQQIVYNKIGAIAHEAQFPDLFQPVQLKTAVESNGSIHFPQEKDPNIIMSRRNFKRDPILVDAKEKKMIDDLLTYQSMHLVDQIFTSANRFFTHGTTALYTQFALTNFIRHQIDATAQSQNHYIPLITPLRTLTSLLAKQGSQEATWGSEYLALGGMKQTLAGWQDQSPNELLKTISNEKAGLVKVIDLLDKGMNLLAVPAKYTEIVTRMGEYISSRKAGNPQIVALEDAGRVTAPFHHIGSLGGSRGRTFVRSIPFFNADLQYMDQALRSMGNPKTRSRYIFTAVVVTASLIAAGQLLIHYGSEKQKQTFKDLQPNDLARYLWLPSPDGQTLIKFPMPQQMTLAGTLLNMLIFQMTQHANYSVGDFIQGAGAILPNPLNVTDYGRFLVTYVPQILKPALETAMNVKDYPSFLPLVPTSLQSLPPSQQFNKATSPLAKWIGTTFNLSPIKVDYLLTGYLGRASGYLTGKPANFNPLQGVTQQQYFAGGRTVQNFYNTKQVNDQNYSAMRKGLVPFTPQEKQQIVREHQSDAQIGKLLTEYRKVDLKGNATRADQLQSTILRLMGKYSK